jgi:dolichyl-phosphate beta-glucosyltransferase
MREGMLKAKGKYVLYTDFDQSTSLHEVERFLQSMLKNEWDLAIGTRGDGDTKRKDSLANRIRAEIFVVVARLWMGLAIKDINCGFKLYTNHAAHEIFSSLVVSRPLKIKHAYMGAIDTEILFLAKKFQYKIIELPVNWERRPFVSHIDLRKEVGTILRDLFMMRLYSYLGKYDHKVAK